MRHRSTVVRDALQGARRFLDETTGLLSDAVDLSGARRWLDELLLIFMEQLDV